MSIYSAVSFIRVMSMHDTAVGWVCRYWLANRNKYGWCRVKLMRCTEYSRRQLARAIRRLLDACVLWSMPNPTGIERIRQRKWGKLLAVKPLPGYTWPDFLDG